MSVGEKNLYYLKLQQRAVKGLLWSGFFLWSLFFIGSVGIAGPAYEVVWISHLLAQLCTLFFCGQLFLAFAATLARTDQLILSILVVAILVFIIGMGILPIVSRDALIYHLAVPKLWIEAGKIFEITWHEWSHFPLLLSLGYAGFLNHGWDQFTPLYHFSFLIVICGVVASFVYYKFQDEYLALVSSFITLTLPICLKMSGEPMADLGLTCFFGTAFALFIFWGEQRGSFRQLIAVGVLLGLALGTKYNALLGCVMLSLTMLAFLQRTGFSFTDAIKSIALVFGIAALIYSPWPIKNYLSTGNPFFPFAGSIFGLSDELPFVGQTKPLEYRRYGYGESWLDIFLIPLRMLFTGQDDNPRQFDGLLSPLLLLAVLPLIVKGKGERRQPWVVNSWLFIVGYFLLSLSLFYALLRYQAPLLVPTVALTAHGVYILSMFFPRFSRVTFYRGVSLLQCLWAGLYIYNVTREVQPFGIWFGTESRDDYLSRRLGEYDLARYINESLPRDAKVYLLFTGNRFFYYDRNVQGSYFSQAPIVNWLSENSSATYLAEKFRAAGITHFAMHLRRTRDSLDTTLNESQKAAWTAFCTDNLELIFQNREQTVWRLK